LELAGEGFRFFDLVRTGESSARVHWFYDKNDISYSIEEMQFAGGSGHKIQVIKTNII
jgi:hypothetical protein